MIIIIICTCDRQLSSQGGLPVNCNDHYLDHRPDFDDYDDYDD